jgi:XTP/dITP diphosphohydrolase
LVNKLLLATTNPGKIQEYLELLADVPFTLTTPNVENIYGDVEETGLTFKENALLKAHYFMEESGLMTISDDSGIEVDYLGGKPGIHSARYGGPGLNDTDRVNLLLSELTGVPWEQRTARFQCVIAIVWQSKTTITMEGSCEGYISYEPKGENGFGYDPIFFYPAMSRTFGELDATTKHHLSHRGEASRKVIQWFKENL